MSKIFRSKRTLVREGFRLPSFCILGLFWLLCGCMDESGTTSSDQKKIPAVSKDLKGQFSLQTGDILVRPNLNWMPGSSQIDSGRNFGHAGIVIRGAEGPSIEEVMNQSIVAEAFLFNQVTRRFIFDRKKQVRTVAAIIPFGNRFKGIRYRLRTKLSEDQKKAIVKFTTEQVGVGQYKFFSLKYSLLDFIENRKKDPALIYTNWHCASFVWFAFYDQAGIDLDSNGGECIFPNDLINSAVFDQPDGRYRF